MKHSIIIFIIGFFGLNCSHASNAGKEYLLIDMPNGWRQFDKQETPYPSEKFSPADESYTDPDHRIIRHRLDYAATASINEYKKWLVIKTKQTCKQPRINDLEKNELTLTLEVICPEQKKTSTGYASIQKIIAGQKNLWVAEYVWRTAAFKKLPADYENSKTIILNHLTWVKLCVGDSACQQLRSQYNDHLIQIGRRAKPGIVKKSPKIEKW